MVDQQDLKVKTDIYKAKRDEFIENGKVFYSLDETSFGKHGRQVYGSGINNLAGNTV
jgi:hypothetical protein